ncbi:TonB-dependent receptor [Rhizorhabdus wittichii RW1]|uniref:TonB-dependent receptor n=1 Tax=Rhizorhabdus wittichii (strain DSM 6014 / CCUG 31198 / JCM 15750 / NBRC 105917 / EY 4224 / RW1) TaxID=392499 RepID=A0A9J9HAJ5_RHIWR|nr:TonB-dependent receptor [Rhizorhabdus wittichii RW1]
MININRTYLSITMMSVLLCGASQAAIAQQAAVDAQNSGDIIVTARMRSEALQNVPASLSVFSSKQIENAKIERPGDYIALTPNVTFSTAQDAGTTYLTVRGISQVPNGETPVAISVDGVLQTSAFQFNEELFDIQQIEVLKGPQGALYGRNAIAGAINITTKPVTNDYEGRVAFGYGNGQATRAEGSVSGPIIKDKLLFRAGVSYRDADGWITNRFLDRKVDDFRNIGADLKLIYEATPDLTFDLRGHYGRITGGAAYFVRSSNAAQQGVVITDAHGVANTVIAPTSNNLGYNKRLLKNVSFKIDYDTGFGRLSSITAYDAIDLLTTFDGYDYSDNQNCFELTSPLSTPYACANPQITFGGLNGGTPFFTAPFNTTFQRYRQRNFSQELRFTSPSDQPLRYIAGLYFLQRKRDLVTATQEDKGFGIVPELDFDPATANQTRAYFEEHNNDKAYAAFAQANYDVTKTIELSAAIRYDTDHRRQTDPRPDIYRLDGLGRPITGPRTRKQNFDAWQPKFTINYRPLRTFSIYANYAKGFRSGGFNAAGTELDPSTGAKVADPIFKKEMSETYEVGFKSELLDRALSISGALFQTDAKNLQVFNFNGVVNAQVVNNIDKARIKGAELEVQARLPEGFALFGGLGYTDTNIRKYDANPTTVGNQLPNTTKFKTNMSLQYTRDIGTSELLIRGDWEHRGKTYFHEGGTPIGIPIRDPLDLFNGQVRLTLASGWSASLWGKNLSNKKYYDKVVVPDYNFQARPRSYGIDITKTF